MSDGEMLSLLVAAAALALGAIAIVLLAIRRSRKPVQPDDRLDGAVRLLLLNDASRGRFWRFESGLESSVELDVFTYRSYSADVPGPWLHEFMDAPLVLLGHSTADVAVRLPGDRYDAAFSWVTRTAVGPIRGDHFVQLVPGVE